MDDLVPAVTPGILAAGATDVDIAMYVPALLSSPGGAGSDRAYERQLERELQPVGPTEHILVCEIARRAAQLDVLDAARAALARQAADALAEILPATQTAAERLALGAVAAPERTAALAAESIAAARALRGGIEALAALRSSQLVDAQADVWAVDPRFAVEARCCAYLLRRFRHGDAVCRRCRRAVGGSWIATRRCWQCAGCHAQTCIRVGTVMSGSHLPLVKWFQAVRILLLRADVASVDLGLHLRITRTATVRRMEAKIRAAINTKDASRLLARLDEVYLPSG